MAMAMLPCWTARSRLADHVADLGSAHSVALVTMAAGHRTSASGWPDKEKRKKKFKEEETRRGRVPQPYCPARC